jgi:hypothetical protein
MVWCGVNWFSVPGGSCQAPMGQERRGTASKRGDGEGHPFFMPAKLGHGGIAVSRASTWPRDDFCRSKIAPRRSRPTACNQLLPIPMPIVATVAIVFRTWRCSMSIPPFRHYSRARPTGPSHWRMYAYRGITDRAPSFELALQPDKTRLIRFGRYVARPNSGRLGEGKPETFGFWHHAFLHAVTQWGSFVIGRKTIKNRMGAKPPAIKTELRGTIHDSIAKTGAWIKRMLQGHLNYFSVSGNHPACGGSSIR